MKNLTIFSFVLGLSGSLFSTKSIQYPSNRELSNHSFLCRFASSLDELDKHDPLYETKKGQINSALDRVKFLDLSIDQINDQKLFTKMCKHLNKFKNLRYLSISGQQLQNRPKLFLSTISSSIKSLNCLVCVDLTENHLDTVTKKHILLMTSCGFSRDRLRNIWRR
jgi:hypothetical protein